ncbi:MAG: NfeD family protein [Clostridium sp.]
MNWSIMMVWLVIAIAGIVIDALSSNFLFIWFTLAAVVSIIAMLLGLSVVWQIVLFVVLSTILIIVAYPLVKKEMSKTVTVTKTQEQGYIGKIYTSECDIESKATIKIGGTYWTVINEGELITKGNKFKILELRGTKFLVALEK